jgi:hypothetical protein
MPTLTPHSDDAPSPRVDVLFSLGELTPAVWATVYQISVAGQFPVRNGVRLSASGGVFATDYETPLGVPVTYRAEMFNGAGVSLGFTGSASTQVDIDPSNVVVQDFLAPRNAIRVDADTSFAGTVTSSRDSQRYVAGTRTVVLQGPLGLAQKIPLRVNTRSLADADRLAAILVEGTCLIRSMPGVVRVSPLLYVAFPDVPQIPVDVQYGGEWVAWDLTGDQISRPDLPIIDSVASNARYAAAFATNAAAAAAYATNFDAIRNPPPEA